MTEESVTPSPVPWQLKPDSDTEPGLSHLAEGHLRDIVVATCKTSWKHTAKFADTSDTENYINWLWKVFPQDPAIPLQPHLPIPSQYEAQDQPTYPHIGMLSFSQESTPPEPTRIRTCLDLADSIVTDGFITKNDPSLLAVEVHHG